MIGPHFPNKHWYFLQEMQSDDHLLMRLCVTGTAAVALAGLLAAQRVVGKPITEHKVLFLGAGEVSPHDTV